MEYRETELKKTHNSRSSVVMYLHCKYIMLHYEQQCVLNMHV